MYNEYKNVRGDIALIKSTLRTIQATDQICSTFGVHRDLSTVQQLYNEGDLAFFANLGVLQQPVSASQKGSYRKLNSKTALFAHNTQQEEINSVDIFDDTAGQGILGRMADMLGLNGYSPGTVAVAQGGPALVSKYHPLISVNPSGYEKFNPISWEQVDNNVVKEMNKATEIGSNVLSEVWADKMFQALSENGILYSEMSGTSLSNSFPTDSLGMQMSSIAKLIKTRDARKTDRDLFYAEIAGFDTHGKQEGALSNKLKEINSALSAFVKEMKSQQLWNDVAVVFVSEFGRTLKANTGNGSDHAWGGNYFMASGDLKGGQIFGEYPDDLTSSGDQIIENVGIVIPSTPWEALWNGVAEWLGVHSNNDLATVLPNRETFEDMLWSGVDLFDSAVPVTQSPTISNEPSVAASLNPSSVPSELPSSLPSLLPSLAPLLTTTSSEVPSSIPSLTPSLAPSLAPSLTPSLAPSLAPTTAYATAVCGGATNKCKPQFKVDLKTATYGVRCCKETEFKRSEKKPWCSVWAASRVGKKLTPNNDNRCKTSATFQEAESYCAYSRARLCTKQELLDQCAKGTGCDLNKVLVWSSEPAVAPVSD